MRRLIFVLAGVCVGLFGVVPAIADAPSSISARYSYRDANCSSSQISDPAGIVFVDWYQRTNLENAITNAMRRRHWADVAGGAQYGRDSGGTCRFFAGSFGREFGPAGGGKPHREKEHIRIFSFKSNEWTSTPHREFKSSSCSGNDSVYKDYNGEGGFDAGREIVVKGFRAQSSATVSEFHARTPFKNTFTQCDIDPATNARKRVPWTGDIVYITNRNPDPPTGP